FAVPADPLPDTEEGKAIRIDKPQSRSWSPASSREIQHALQAARAVPDVRIDLVTDTRRRIAQGTYRVRPDVIAWRLLEARR
ncbi:MAG: flagellar biosynthesis anti-sigma factor FlgM, partial [Candidatus Limnocylindrales bacterium]